MPLPGPGCPVAASWPTRSYDRWQWLSTAFFGFRAPSRSGGAPAVWHDAQIKIGAGIVWHGQGTRPVDGGDDGVVRAVSAHRGGRCGTASVAARSMVSLSAVARLPGDRWQTASIPGMSGAIPRKHRDHRPTREAAAGFAAVLNRRAMHDRWLMCFCNGRSA